MQLTSQILAFGRICYVIKQYMQLSNMQLIVQFSYWMAGIGYCFLKFYAINQDMQLSNMQLSDTVCISQKTSKGFIPSQLLWSQHYRMTLLCGVMFLLAQALTDSIGLYPSLWQKKKKKKKKKKKLYL